VLDMQCVTFCTTFARSTLSSKTNVYLQVGPFLGAFATWRKATISFVMSVRLSTWNNWTAAGRNFWKYDI
jgi:hypothetical protein